MNKSILALSALTLILMFAAFINVFGGINVPKQFATVTKAFNNTLSAFPSDNTERVVFKSYPIPDEAFLTEEEKLQLFNQIHDKIKPIDTEEFDKDDDEEEEKIDVSDWKIFYTKTDFKNIGAYVLKYPKDWVMNDTLSDKKVLTYKFDNDIYNLTFYERDVNIAALGKFDTSTTTIIGEAEYTKMSIIQNGTTTVVAYIPKAQSSFGAALGSLPAKESFTYEKMYDRILSTFAVELADYPFRILDLNIVFTGPVFTTNTAVAKPAIISWNIRALESLRNASPKIKFWIEDEDGENVFDIKGEKDYDLKNFNFHFPDSARENIFFGRKYRLVAQGELDYRKTKKAYSRYFTITNHKEFEEAKIGISSVPDAPGVYVITASVKNISNPNHKFFIFFGDGEYSVLENGDINRYWGEWRKMLKKGQEIYLMRTTQEVINNRFYGARSYDGVGSYADVVQSALLK